METTAMPVSDISTTSNFHTTSDNPPQPGTRSPISTEFVITGISKDSKSTDQIVTTPAVGFSSSGTVTISRNSVVSNDISPTEGLTYASTGKRSTSLFATLGASGKSSTIQLASSVNVNTTKITNFHTSGDFLTLYVTSIGAEGSIQTSSAGSSKVKTVESRSTTMMPTEKTTVGSGEIESLMTTRGSGKTLSTSELPSEPEKTSSSSSASSIASKPSSPLTKAQSLSPEPSSPTIFESSKPSTSVPVTTIFPSTLAKSTTRIPIPTTTKITAKPDIPTIKPCHNGGTYDGIKCICLDNFYGALCEHIIDRVRIGRSVTTTIEGSLRFTHLDFRNNFKDSNSNEYKKFDTDFKKDMKVVYKDVPGYQDVQILSISNGSVVVDNNIIIEIVYKSNVSVSQQYKDAIKHVKEALNKTVCSNPDGPIRNCISDEFNVTETDSLESEDELCFRKVPNGFQDFFNSVVDESGLICVSQCDSMSWKYTNCQDGSCQILNNTGPHCLCPRTDLYIYTSPNCNGKILKSGIYGGIGAAIAVLLIIICVAVGFVTRKEKNTRWDLFANDAKINWFDNVEEDGHDGITNLGANIDNEDQDSAKNSFSSKKETFKPNLEIIDSTFELKIEKPQFSLGLK
ncbi:mucin-17-like [Dendrobates tinctorius]|uniref:mucin-17-like n=1 Tax=Dendrobates tinctorius TaxID=92724 RepID=UPI003CCA1B44